MRTICAAAGLLAAGLVLVPSQAMAQFPPPPGPPPVSERWPDPQRQQAEPIEPRPQQQAPTRRPAPQARPKPESDAAPPKRAAQPRAPANVVACNGVFAKDSTHLKLAIKYDSRNIAYGPVDGPDGSKISASILFPNDPKRRLEVLWNNEAGRADTSVIAINGRSQWVAPKGLRLGMPLAALEKANGKPFKLSSFGDDGTASVLSWDAGGLASLPGGCKVGMRLAVDAKASADARSAVTGAKEFQSNDAALRAVRPTVVEILIGY